MSALTAFSVPAARAAEHIVLSNGFSLECDHRGSVADGRIRLFLDAAGTNFLEVDVAKIVASEAVSGSFDGSAPTLRETLAKPTKTVRPAESTRPAQPASASSLHSLIAAAGSARNVDIALLESVVQAESGGHAHAVSRTGARGLMQLMPATAKAMGVTDSFAPEQNLRGGTAYLDGLLTRYHDDITLALAAYNAGPGAVDRYHGIPPFRETRAYVARIIHEFNRRTLESRATASRAGNQQETTQQADAALPMLPATHP